MMFDFGWMFWALFFVIFFGCGRMCGWGVRRYADRRRRYREDDEEPQPARLGDATAAQPARPIRPRETPVQRLQKRFVDGRITIEEYERELDHLDRLE